MSSKEEILKRFELSAKMALKLNSGVTNTELLKLYGLYKQSKFGNCNVEKPGLFDLKESEKWSAWNKHKGMPQIVAMENYSNFVMTLIDKYGIKKQPSS